MQLPNCYKPSNEIKVLYPSTHPPKEEAQETHKVRWRLSFFPHDQCLTRQTSLRRIARHQITSAGICSRSNAKISHALKAGPGPALGTEYQFGRGRHRRPEPEREPPP